MAIAIVAALILMLPFPSKVSLEDLYNGKTAKLAVSRDKIVGKPETCRDCNGKGVIVRLRQIGPGMVQQIQQQWCVFSHG